MCSNAWFDVNDVIVKFTLNFLTSMDNTRYNYLFFAEI